MRMSKKLQEALSEESQALSKLGLRIDPNKIAGCSYIFCSEGEWLDRGKIEHTKYIRGSITFHATIECEPVTFYNIEGVWHMNKGQHTTTGEFVLY